MSWRTPRAEPLQHFAQFGAVARDSLETEDRQRADTSDRRGIGGASDGSATWPLRHRAVDGVRMDMGSSLCHEDAERNGRDMELLAEAARYNSARSPLARRSD
jgi:hypothetical protein